MNIDKMNKLTKLNLSLKDNNIEEIELNKWLEWSGNRLNEWSLDLSENQVNNVEWNGIEDCEVYLDL